MQIFFILGIPLLLSAITFLLKTRKAVSLINCLGYAVVLILGIALLREIALGAGTRNLLFGVIYLDTLSVYFIFVISFIAFAVSLYSIGYLRKEEEAGLLSDKKIRIYYLLFNLFCLSMFIVPSVNNLGILWVAIEMTTLISAFLVGFYNTKQSVEAAWKYIIICSVGIIFALLGTILFSYSFSMSGLSKSLNWSDIAPVAHILDKDILKVAFIFILVGYGTKAGLAPMHTWLPDAHSQAPAPISALLSGVLLKTALYAILRFGMITIKGVGFDYFSKLMIFFGIISLIVSGGFILVQKDLKRLLAYSSIEHIGIIAIGFGLGTPLSITGAALHVFNHAVTKTLMFFGAGNIISVFKKHNMNAITGVIRVIPFTGIMMLGGVFMLTGFPPFSLFISEIMVIISAFVKGAYTAGIVLLVFLSVIFAGFIYHFGKMLFGSLPKGMRRESEPLSAKISYIFLCLPICAIGMGFLIIGKDWLWWLQRLLQL